MGCRPFTTFHSSTATISLSALSTFRRTIHPSSHQILQTRPVSQQRVGCMMFLEQAPITPTKPILYLWKRRRQMICSPNGVRGLTWRSRQKGPATASIPTQTTVFVGPHFRHARVLVLRREVTGTAALANITIRIFASRHHTAKLSRPCAQMRTALLLTIKAQHLSCRKVAVGRLFGVQLDDRLIFLTSCRHRCTSLRVAANYRSFP